MRVTKTKSGMTMFTPDDVAESEKNLSDKDRKRIETDIRRRTENLRKEFAKQGAVRRV